MKMPRIGFKDAPEHKFMQAFSLKEADVQTDGTFTGYASVFGEVDSYKEVVPKGAFKASLKAWAKKGQLPRLLWMHRSDSPIGIYTKMVEDDKGLYVEGQLSLETTKGKEAYVLLKMGALDGLSIGYVATEWTENKKTGIVTLDVIDLWEVSLVTFPAGPSARVDGVKSILSEGKLPSLKEFESFLREAGFSNTQAKAIAGKGLAHLGRQREADSKRDIQLSEVIDLVTGVNQ
jgi:HK97 family phage prohead protease